MPLKQLIECPECGKSWDKDEHESCPKCEENEIELALEKDEFLDLTNTKL